MISGEMIRRLGLDGGESKKRDIAAVRRIISAFSLFPYENISKIIKYSGNGCVCDPSIFRGPDEIICDHLEKRLGGTCFSLTWFLKEVLDYFEIPHYIITAHMRAGRNVHCAVIAEAEGRKFLLDPGYLYSEPLPMQPVSRGLSPMGFTMTGLFWDGGMYNLYTYTAYSGIKWRYAFEDRAVDEAEFREYWADSFTGKSMRHICVSRSAEGRQLFFLKDFLRISDINGKTNIKTGDAAASKLSEYFGIDEDVYAHAFESLTLSRKARGDE